jgi:hypothetical protein
MRLTDDRLVVMALGALEEVLATSHYRPVPRSMALRLVLGYLASRGDGRRDPHDRFWRAVAHERPQERWGQANAALNGIYLGVGIKRDLAVVSAHERRARARLHVE